MSMSHLVGRLYVVRLGRLPVAIACRLGSWRQAHVANGALVLAVATLVYWLV
jgi:hypothetical protein